jgi:hypothetical protein
MGRGFVTWYNHEHLRHGSRRSQRRVWCGHVWKGFQARSFAICFTVRKSCELYEAVPVPGHTSIIPHA